MKRQPWHRADSQTVKWVNNRSLKNYDSNKKVKGMKRYIAVDKNGFLVAVMVTVAYIHNSWVSAYDDESVKAEFFKHKMYDDR